MCFCSSKAVEFYSQNVGISHDKGASVRVVGADGAAANVGLLQVRMQGSQNNEFGSVCGMNSVCFFCLWNSIIKAFDATLFFNSAGGC